MKIIFRSLTTLALTSALFACATGSDEVLTQGPVYTDETEAAVVEAPPAVGQRGRFSPFEFEDFPLMISDAPGAKPREARGLNNAQLRGALRRLDGDVDCGDFKRCAEALIRKLDRTITPRPTELLVGLGSSAAATLAALAEKTGAGARLDISTSGRILPQCLDAKGGPQRLREGFSFNRKTGALRICVVVRTTTTDAGGVKNSTFEYYEVAARGAKFEKSCVDDYSSRRCAQGGASDANVFPAAASRTGLQIDRAKTMPAPGVTMNWKLYAWGQNIQVKRYGLIENVDWVGGVPPVPVWKSNNLYDRWQGAGPLTQRLRKLFTRSDGACVDMMFVDRPPASLTAGDRVVYCLGRCDQPPILNTL